MKLLITFLLLLSTLVCFAEVYQQTNSQGGTTYSDTPLNGNAEILNFPTTSRSPQPTTTTPTITPPSNARQPYTTFLIDTPKDQETIHNQPVIGVIIKMEPDLQPGDKIQLYLDGNPWGSAVPTTHLQLFQISRGVHQVYAVVMDNNQTILKQSDTITIYIHQNSVFSPTNNRNTPSGI